MGSYGNRYWDTGWWHGIREYDEFLGAYKWYVGIMKFLKKSWRTHVIGLVQTCYHEFPDVWVEHVALFKRWWTVMNDKFGIIQGDVFPIKPPFWIILSFFFPRILSKSKYGRQETVKQNEAPKLKLELEHYHCNPFISQQDIFLRSSPIRPVNTNN